MKVNNRRLQMISSIVEEACERLVRIDWNMLTEEGQDVEFKVNWGCCGSQTTEDARTMAKYLELGCKVADELNRLHITEIDYEVDEMIKNPDDYKRFYGYMSTLISCGAVNQIESFLTR